MLRVKSPVFARNSVIAAFTALALAASLGLRANDAPGSVSGKVVDSTGKPAAGVRITFTALSKPKKEKPGGVKRNAPLMLAQNAGAVTDANGAFAVKSLAAGRYIWEAGNPAVSGYASDGLTVESGKNAELNIKLEPPSGGQLE
jgi:Carboxypeptidase regulatory-like domain